MAKKYISVRSSIYQHEADNWLLMIPERELSNSAKIVYLILKKMQAHDLTCMTDANSWLKISGMKFDRIRECLVELEIFGLVELYHSTTNANSNRRLTVFTAYLLDHYLMKKRYPIFPCPHDGDSFPNAQSPDNVLRNSPIAQTMKEFIEQAKDLKNDTHEANDANQESD